MPYVYQTTKTLVTAELLVLRITSPNTYLTCPHRVWKFSVERERGQICIRAGQEDDLKL